MEKQIARTLPSGTRVTHKTYGPGTWKYVSQTSALAWIHFDGEHDLRVVDFADVIVGQAVGSSPTGPPTSEPRIAHQRWDAEDGRISLDMLAADLTHVGQGAVFLYPTDTGSDEEGYLLSDRELTADEVSEATRLTPKHDGR
jgi:hypothetical protein